MLNPTRQFSGAGTDNVVAPGPWLDPDTDPPTVPEGAPRNYGLYAITADADDGSTIGKLVVIPENYTAIDASWRGADYFFWYGDSWPQNFRIRPTDDRHLGTAAYAMYSLGTFGELASSAEVQGQCYLIEVVEGGERVGYLDVTQSGCTWYARPDMVDDEGYVTLQGQGIRVRRIADHPTDLADHRHVNTPRLGTS